PARGASEPKTRIASALLEQYQACFGQHPLLPRGQAAAGLPSRQVADYLNDLDQVPLCQLLPGALIPLPPTSSILATEHSYTTADLDTPRESSQGPKLIP